MLIQMRSLTHVLPVRTLDRLEGSLDRLAAHGPEVDPHHQALPPKDVDSILLDLGDPLSQRTFVQPVQATLVAQQQLLARARHLFRNLPSKMRAEIHPMASPSNRFTSSSRSSWAASP